MPNARPKRESKRRGKLVIVELPAKARTIGRYLGKGYTVRASVGHVRDLLRSQLSVDVDNGFTPKYRVPNEKKEVVKGLTAEAAKAEEIFLATDPDREGEAIAWHLIEAAQDRSRAGASRLVPRDYPGGGARRPSSTRGLSTCTWWMRSRAGGSSIAWWATT